MRAPAPLGPLLPPLMFARPSSEAAAAAPSPPSLSLRRALRCHAAPSLPRSFSPRPRSERRERTDGRAPSLAPRPRRATVCPPRSPHTQGFAAIFPSPKLCPTEEPTSEARFVHPLHGENHVFVCGGRLGAEESGLSPPHVSDPLRLRLDSAKVALHFQAQGMHCDGVETPTPGCNIDCCFFATFCFCHLFLVLSME